jgi:hypothetical protein
VATALSVSSKGLLDVVRDIQHDTIQACQRAKIVQIVPKTEHVSDLLLWENVL